MVKQGLRQHPGRLRLDRQPRCSTPSADGKGKSKIRGPIECEHTHTQKIKNVSAAGFEETHTLNAIFVTADNAKVAQTVGSISQQHVNN
jgi:hypothetical protein